MREAIRTVAKAAVGALITGEPSGIAVAAVESLIDRIVTWGGSRDLHERLMVAVETRLADLPAHEIGGPENLTAAFGLAAVLFDNAGLSAEQLGGLGRKGALKEQIRRFDQRPESRDEPEASLCRQHVIPAVLDAFYADPEALAEIDLAFKDAVLDHLGEIAGLPDATASALRRMAAKALLRTPRRRFDPARHAPSALLQAEYAIVPFEGRTELLDDALRWCEAARDLGIRLYFSPGGMGKTRFALELCERAWARPGWRSGFLGKGLADTPEWLLPNLKALPDALLVVVDYAETRRDDIIRLLDFAHDLPQGRKLRLVLLARDAGDWWCKLREASAKAQSLLPGPATEEPIPIGALAPKPEDRAGIFARALTAFRERVAPATAPAGAPALDHEDFRSVLMIHMAALAAADGRAVGDAEALLQDALARERRAWARGLDTPSLAGLTSDDAQEAIALLTLCNGAANQGEAMQIIAQAPRLSGRLPATLEDLVRLFARLYPSARRGVVANDPAIEPLQPDLLGEELVDRALSASPALLGAGLECAQEAALTMLVRLATRKPPAVRWLKQALAEPAFRMAIATNIPMMWQVLAERVKPEDISDDHVRAYIATLLSGLQESQSGQRYQSLYPTTHLIHPAKIQFILSTTGFAFCFVGQNLSGSPKLEIHRVNAPFQKAIFGESVAHGRAALTFAIRFTVLSGLVIAQKQAIELAPGEIDKIGGSIHTGDRLIDTTPQGDVTLINCFFHFVRDGQYESLCQDLMFIDGGLAVILSRDAACERVRHLDNILQRAVERGVRS